MHSCTEHLNPTTTHSWISLEFVSGAIDLAAKSAGIIPGSPCREVEAPNIDKAIVESEEAMDSAPAAPELEPDLLDQEPSEVRNNPLPRSYFTFGCTADHILVCLFSLSAGITAEWRLSTISGGWGLPLGPSQCCFPIGYLSTRPPRGVSSIWRAANSNQRLYYWARHQLALWYDLLPMVLNLGIRGMSVSVATHSLTFGLSVSFPGDGSLLSPPKLNGSDRSKLLPSSCDSWMPSPTHDPQWYPSDSTDSSLGCLLCKYQTRLVSIPCYQWLFILDIYLDQ